MNWWMFGKGTLLWVLFIVLNVYVFTEHGLAVASMCALFTGVSIGYYGYMCVRNSTLEGDDTNELDN